MKKLRKIELKKKKKKKKKSKNLLSKLNPLKHFKDGKMKTIRKKNEKIIGKDLNLNDVNNK